MDSNLHHRHRIQDSQHQQQQMNSGLMRYKSAPSSYFSSLINSTGRESCDEFLNPRPSTPETDRIFSRFVSTGGGGAGTDDASSHNLCDVGQSSSQSLKHETDIFHRHHDQQQQQNNCYSSASQMIYQNQSQPVASMAMDRLAQVKMSGGGGGGGNLIRQSSSPAGFLSHLNVENGYGVMRGMGNFGAGNGTNVEASFPSPSRLKGQIDFSSVPPSSGRMAPISENGSKSGPENGSFGEDHNNDRYITGFPIGSWDDSTILSDSFLDRLEGDDRKTFSSMNLSDNQNAEGGNRPPNVLSRHLSLPTSSAELSAMEKLLQFQDSVPFKTRAKRGFATHPRSIAERVRRTRISERMRKLQELVPNMDKQTNTSDMLDLAVDYIKDLQKQVKTLSDNRAKCTCSNKQKP